MVTTGSQLSHRQDMLNLNIPVSYPFKSNIPVLNQDEGRWTTDDGRRTKGDGRRKTDDGGRRMTDDGRRRQRHDALIPFIHYVGGVVATFDLSAKNLAVRKTNFVCKLSSRPWVNL